MIRFGIDFGGTKIEAAAIDEAGAFVAHGQPCRTLGAFDLHHHLFSGDSGETVIGIAGLAGILLPLNQQSDNQVLFWVTIGVVLLAGVVMSARLQLHAHTPRQVLVGALTGLLIGFFGVILQF